MRRTKYGVTKFENCGDGRRGPRGCYSRGYVSGASGGLAIRSMRRSEDAGLVEIDLASVERPRHERRSTIKGICSRKRSSEIRHEDKDNVGPVKLGNVQLAAASSPFQVAVRPLRGAGQRVRGQQSFSMVSNRRQQYSGLRQHQRQNPRPSRGHTATPESLVALTSFWPRACSEDAASRASFRSRSAADFG